MSAIYFDPSNMLGRMLTHTNISLAQIKEWHAALPDTVIDYRITDVIAGLSLAAKALDHLHQGKQYPEWEAAMESFRKSHGIEGPPPHDA